MLLILGGIQLKENKRILIHHKTINYIIVSCFIFMCVAWILTSIPISAAPSSLQTEETTIRVAFPIQEGLTELTKEGNYTGYTYDYLMEISQYTNWNYEFIQVVGDLNTQISTLLDMLLNGEIDLMGAMIYNDNMAKIMNYPGYNYGTSYTTLYVLDENTEITSTNYTSVPNLKVAVIKNSKQHITKLKQFSEMNGLNIEIISCESDAEQIELLKNGTVDALLNIDISIFDELLRPIASFAPEPFYFATQKGRTDIINQLNMAILNINESNPYFMATLHEKYFSLENNMIYLSEEEKEYIKQTKVLKVAMLGEQAPIQYKDKKTHQIKGISNDILDYITKHTGLQFDIIWANSMEEYNKLIKEKQVDIISGVILDYESNSFQTDYNTTISYLDIPIMMVVNKKVDASNLDGKKLTLLTGEDTTYSDSNEISFFNTVKECLDAVDKGITDYYYGNSYTIQYYRNTKPYKNIILLPQSESLSQRISFGILKPIDVHLLSIFNKTIQSISENELQNFLYKNAFQKNEVTFFSYLKENPWYTFLAILVIILLFISVSLFWNAHHYKKSNEKNKLENQRYEQISELSNEFLYEYNILQDTLKLPEKCANFLGCEKVINHLEKNVIQTILDVNQRELFQYITLKQDGEKEILFHLPDGKTHWLKIISKTILNHNKTPIYSIGKIVDIQKEKEKQNLLLEKSQKDSLTNIYNAATSRTLIHDFLTSTTQEAIGALFILDIDYFKTINDNFGHYTGDFVLVQIATILNHIFRKEDIVGRLGGDEFIVFVKGIHTTDILEKKCTLICEKTKEIKIEEQPHMISVSIGVSICKPNQDYNELYKQADNALYVVKKRGRNGFEIT